MPPSEDAFGSCSGRSGDWTASTDLLVVGAGIAGMAAAIVAHDAGAAVTVVEKTAEPGGNCRYSGGNLLDVTGDGALAHLEALCSNKTGTPVLEAYLAGLHEVEPWLHSLGARTTVIPHSGQGGSLRESWPNLPGATGVRYYRVEGEDQSAGMALWETVRRAAQNRQITVRTSTAAEELILSDAGEVLGAVISGPDGPYRVRAAAGVLLATGGFENDLELCDTYLPISPTYPIGHLGNTGDGLRMAARAGASLWHTANFFGWWALRRPEYPAVFPLRFACPSFLFVNADGRRFCSEAGHEAHEELRGLTTCLPSRPAYLHLPAYAVFDEAARLAGPLCARVGPNDYEWSDDNQREVDWGWLLSGEGPKDLAAATSLDADTLADTLSRFNGFAQDGRDEDFGRASHTLRPVDTRHLYAAPIWPAVATTCGGPRRDHRSRVVDRQGRPIPGLYAAGGNGAIWGHLTQHGGGLTDGLVFGRIAAEQAAERPAVTHKELT